MIDPDKLHELFAALNTVRAALPEVAIIFPETAVVDGILVAAIPLVEEGLGLLFEAASVALSHATPAEAREALTARLQEKAQAALDAKFGGGNG